MSNKGGAWEKYKDIPIPEEYSYDWKHFMNIWLHCEYDFNGNRIFTFRTIRDYEECMWIQIPPEHIKNIFRIKEWAEEQLHEMNKDDD